MKTIFVLAAFLPLLQAAHAATIEFAPNGLAMHPKNIRIYLFLAAYIAAPDNYSSHHSKTNLHAFSTNHR